MKRAQRRPVLAWASVVLWLWLSFLPWAGTAAAPVVQDEARDRAAIASLAQRYLQAGVEAMQSGDLSPLAAFLPTGEQERLTGRFLGSSGLCWLWRYYREDAAAGWKGEPVLSQSFSPSVVLVQGEEALCYLGEEIRVSAPGLVSGRLCQSAVVIAHTIRLGRTGDGWAIWADLAWEENVQPGPGMQAGGGSPFPRVAGFPAYEVVVASFPQPVATVLERPATPSRGAVAAYADLYALNPNAPYYPDFSATGGDCANFISQALYEGGWAMDTSSPPEQQWWFHWPGDWSKPIRCSDSWVFAGDYAEGGGLGYTVKHNPPGSNAPNGACPGRADLHWGELKLGDLALVHTQEDPDTHHLGVVAAFDPDHGTPTPFPLVDAHSNNRYHYPLDWNGAFSLQQIDVLLLRYPSPTPLTLTATPAAFTFSCTRSQANPLPQTLEVWNAGTGTLNWTTSEGVAWLSLSPTSGSSTGEHDPVTVSVNASGLVAGTYTATITLAAIGADNSPQQVLVNLTVQEPLPRIGYSPASVTFSYTQGQSNPSPQILDVWNSGGGTLNWTASEGARWLSLAPASGSSTGERDPVTVSVNALGFVAGTYTATITLAAIGADNSPQQVLVNLTVQEPLPRIGYSPASVTFSYTQGQSNPSPQILDVWNSGGGSLNWTASEGAGWLSLAPTSGSSTGEHDPITLSVDASGLVAGTYTATITLAAAGADNSPQNAGVTLVVADSSTHTVTFSLQPNWNMISLPLTPASTDPQVVFGRLPSPWYLFEWNPLAGTYIGKELISLRLGAGYWLKVPTAVDYPVSGLPNGKTQTGIDLGLDWNLIGVPYQGAIPWGAVRVNKDGGVLVTLDQAITSDWIQGMFFHWSGSTYEMLTTGGNFQSLFGYWAKAKVTGVRLVFLKP